VLLIAGLAALMDSVMIYTEPFVVTGAGPSNRPPCSRRNWSTIALGRSNLGKAAACPLVYNLII